MNQDEMKQLYNHQPVIRQLVDSMESGLLAGCFTIYELRDACTLAMNNYAIRKPPSPIVVPDGSRLIK